MYAPGARLGSGVVGGGVAGYGIQTGMVWMTVMAVISVTLIVVMTARRIRRTSAHQRP